MYVCMYVCIHYTKSESPTHGLWATCDSLIFIIRPGAIFVNYVCTLRITYFRRLVIPLTAVCHRTVREPARNYRCGPFL